MGLIGAILGDIAGSRFEFAQVTPRRKEYNYELFTDNNKIFAHDLTFTDDTTMSIACADACLNKLLFCKPNFAKYYDKWGTKYPDVGYGGAFKQWLYAKKKRPYGSFGNGSAMRCSFIGEYAKTLKRCDKLATLSAACTHNHPEGIKGAVVLAHCVWMAEHGASKEEILKYGIEQYPQPADEYCGVRCSAHDEDGDKYTYSPYVPTSKYCDEITYLISCQGSVPVAIRCFYETNSFEECMYLINSMEVDTDTIGAIAGAICHSYYKKCTDNDEELLKRFLPEDMLCVLRKAKAVK